MLDYGPVISEVGSIFEHDFNAVAVKVEDSSIEVTILIAPSGWCAIRTASGVQGGGVEVSNGSTTGSGEGDVRGAGFYAAVC